ncbi:hypothetical protein K5I04_04775 [Murdochiella sp. Marseille-P8839]|nr:hypothetical protein [Murdochiella sp. Marseille-P8839]
MEKQTANINVKLELTINGMTIDAFHKELVFPDEEDDPASGKNNGVCLDNMPGVGTAEIHGGPYWAIRNAELSIGKGEGTD